jgi:hypothetical protein
LSNLPKCRYLVIYNISADIGHIISRLALIITEEIDKISTTVEGTPV